MNHPEIIIIAALAESNRVIGNQGKLPWAIPEDSRRFQQLTIGHTVIMGRKTWEYDVKKCPLIQRRNIIISSSPQTQTIAEDCPTYPFELLFASSLQAALQEVSGQEKVYIIGGATVYTQALELSDTLELTLIAGNFEGDVCFPEYTHLISTQFELVHQELRTGYRFETYKRLR